MIFARCGLIWLVNIAKRRPTMRGSECCLAT